VSDNVKRRFENDIHTYIHYGSELKSNSVAFLFRIVSYLVTDCVWGVGLLENFERLSFYEAMTSENVI